MAKARTSFVADGYSIAMKADTNAQILDQDMLKLTGKKNVKMESRQSLFEKVRMFIIYGIYS